MKQSSLIILLVVLGTSIFMNACQPATASTETSSEIPFLWENANIYFLLTDLMGKEINLPIAKTKHP